MLFSLLIVSSNHCALNITCETFLLFPFIKFLLGSGNINNDIFQITGAELGQIPCFYHGSLMYWISKNCIIFMFFFLPILLCLLLRVRMPVNVSAFWSGFSKLSFLSVRGHPLDYSCHLDTVERRSVLFEEAWLKWWWPWWGQPPP